MQLKLLSRTFTLDISLGKLKAYIPKFSLPPINKKKLFIGFNCLVVTALIIYALYYFFSVKPAQEIAKDIAYNKNTEWTVVGGVDESYISYADLKSIHQEGSYISIVVLTDYKSAHHRDNLSALQNLLFNCTDNKFIESWGKKYSEHMGAGIIIHHKTASESDLSSPEVLFPNDRKIFDIACEAQKKS